MGCGFTLTGFTTTGFTVCVPVSVLPNFIVSGSGGTPPTMTDLQDCTPVELLTDHKKELLTVGLGLLLSRSESKQKPVKDRKTQLLERLGLSPSGGQPTSKNYTDSCPVCGQPGYFFTIKRKHGRYKAVKHNWPDGRQESHYIG